VAFNSVSVQAYRVVPNKIRVGLCRARYQPPGRGKAADNGRIMRKAVSTQLGAVARQLGGAAECEGGGRQGDKIAATWL
jgi:hypothetical protein